ncbi:hypothetical protein PTMSG1_05259 [Pyrenophora teres f. maculata]|nr:hypothetical protein PTMSG1_05259 [Pyrenophora teres f. maculata]
MSNATTAPLPLTLKEVLHIYLLCFEAAADALPQEPVAYAVPCSHPSVPVKIWQVWTCKDVVEKGPPKYFNLLPQQPARLHEALARKDLCEFFCWLLEREISEKVAERFGGSALWLMSKPKINFLLASRGGRNQLNIPLHSVLLLQTAGGQDMVMDGTLRQYLWAPSTWLQTMEEWEDRRVDKSDGCQSFGFAPSYYKEDMEADTLEVDMGFWMVVRERMNRLFEDLDWEELEALEAGKRVEKVKQMARDKFLGTWEEACDIYQSHSEENR